MSELAASGPGHVVIAGGGVAALEALIALRELAPDRVRVTRSPRSGSSSTDRCRSRSRSASATRRITRCRRSRASSMPGLVHDALVNVEPAARHAIGRSELSLDYDSLLVAIGARAVPVYPHAITFGTEGAPEALAEVLADLEQGYARCVAFVVPSTVAWSLPLYELAIVTARHVWGMGVDGVKLTFVTPESRPLEAFGREPSAVLVELLAGEGIEFVGSASPDVRHGHVIAGERRIDVDRTITLPVPIGPAIDGLPADEAGFVPVDEHGRVRGLDGVFAAGDVTSSPIRQDGLAAQQAVAAAEAIATRHGADLEPAPYRPVLRGILLTGRQRGYKRPSAPRRAHPALSCARCGGRRQSSRAATSPHVSCVARRPRC